MQEVDGKTVMKQDAQRKVRKDYLIEDEELIKLIQRRVQRRIAPEILKVHQFNANRMERYIVACYTAEDGGHFFMHRDNTTKGTAHRRFAVSINLNSDFDGGELSFPEYSRKSIKIPTGTAVVFSCSLLHTVSKVTRGYRYAFLPFLYDDAAAKVREANNVHLGEGVAAYRGASAGRAQSVSCRKSRHDQAPRRPHCACHRRLARHRLRHCARAGAGRRACGRGGAHRRRAGGA